jgi:hypothetical protein
MRLGEVWPGKAEQGLAGLGEATVADGSTEPSKRFPAALFGGWIRPGLTGYGLDRHGGVRQQLQTAARSFAKGSLLLSVEGRPGVVGLAKMRFGKTRCGTAWQ